MRHTDFASVDVSSSTASSLPQTQASSNAVNPEISSWPHTREPSQFRPRDFSILGDLQKLQRVGAALDLSPVLSAAFAAPAVALKRRGAIFKTASYSLRASVAAPFSSRRSPGSLARAAGTRSHRMLVDIILMVRGGAQHPKALILFPSANAIKALAASSCAPIERPSRSRGSPAWLCESLR